MGAHIAIDIGGSHGRGVLGNFQHGHWSTVPLGEFSTKPVFLDGESRWDVQGMLRGMQAIMQAACLHAKKIDTIAVDTMGVAFGLLDTQGQLLTPPVYTRAPQEEGLRQELIQHFGSEHLYAMTGLEQEKLNTLYYLAKIKRENPHILQKTSHILMLPDLFNHLLCGVMKTEYTIATTSHLWDIGRRTWSAEILSYLGLEAGVFPPLGQCGEFVGSLLPEMVSHPALSGCRVVHAAAHDTASAIYSLSEAEQAQLLISAGTWGMLGCLLQQPLLVPEARRARFANEGAADGKIKFLNNAPSMSILLACIEHWNQSGACWGWEAVFACASASLSNGSRIDLYHPDFRGQKNMPEKICQYCAKTGQAVPQTPGEIVLVVLESIASQFGLAFRQLERLTKKTFHYAILVGGASRNQILIQKCQDALGIPVVVASDEASIWGNLKAQLAACQSTPLPGSPALPPTPAPDEMDSAH